MNGPIFERLQADMRQMFAPANEAPAPVTDLHAERVKREREASERRHFERTTPGDAA